MAYIRFSFVFFIGENFLERFTVHVPSFTMCIFFFPDRYYMYCKCNYLKKVNVLINKCKLNIL